MDKQAYFLKKYKIELNQNATPDEQNQQMKIGFGVKNIEIGDKPYIFISYSHKDSAVVFPAIKALQDKGYPVWYDDSIRPGANWSDYIADHVRNATLVIAFMSVNAIASLHCQSEIRYAFNNRRPMLIVRLDQAEYPSGLEMQLSQWQMFSAYMYDGDTYIRNLADDGFIADTVGSALNAYYEEKRCQVTVQEPRCTEDDEVVHEHADKEWNQVSDNATEIEKKYLRTVAELEVERGRRARVERKCREATQQLDKERRQKELTDNQLSNARRYIATLKAAEKKNNASQCLTPESITPKEELNALHDSVQDRLLDQSYSGYKKAIDIYNYQMMPLVEVHPELKDDMHFYKGSIYNALYRDACSLENRDMRKAYALYDALPKHHFDTAKNMEKLEKRIVSGCIKSTFVIFFLYFLLNDALMIDTYHKDESFWSFTLISVCLMAMAILVWCFCNWKWISVDYSGKYAAICFWGIGICEFFTCLNYTSVYREMSIWMGNSMSIFNSVVSGIIGVVLLKAVTAKGFFGRWYRIPKISE